MMATDTNKHVALLLARFLRDSAESTIRSHDLAQMAAEKDEGLFNILTDQYNAECDALDRLEALSIAEANGKLFIIEEGELVHALAKTMCTTWNTATGEDKNWEDYIGRAQQELANLKQRGAVR